MATTYRKLSQLIIDAHYNGVPLPEAAITQRFVAERIATKVAKYATISAFGNSKQGETTYSNDQFISTFYNQPLLTDAVTADKYIVLPATPAGLPNNREIVQVSFTGSPNVHVIPMQSKDDFMESLLPDISGDMVLYRLENGNLVFRKLPAIINSPVNVKMVGAVPGATLLDSVLNIPKEVEDAIMLEVLNELVNNYKVQPQLIEKGEPS